MFRKPFKIRSVSSFPRRRESIDPHIFWIPAFAGMTKKRHKSILLQTPRRYIILIIIMFIFSICSMVFADSTAKLIDRGNKSWIAGDYEGAIKSYDEAAVDNPESPYIYFNKGAALYKQGDYNAATEEFEKAALKSKDPEMEAKSRFNLGNCTFREAERQMDSDLKKALEYCQKSILHYQDALKLDPVFDKAAENIEIVRLLMKNILDEIKKKEEEAKQKEQQARENAEDLQELIKRQESALDKNRQISGSQVNKDEKRKQLTQLADEQKVLTGDTQKLADKIKDQSGQNNQGGTPQALTHLNNAVKEQEAAEGNLRNLDPSIAQKNQENAIEELKAALTPPDQNQNQQGGDQQKEGEQQQEKGKQGQNKDEFDKGDPSEKKKQPDKEEQTEIAKVSEDAQEILDEEKENQKQRRIRESGGYSDVEKDW